MTSHEPEFVSVGDFATATSLSARSVWRLLAEGRLPSIRVRRRRLIPFAAALAAVRDLGESRAAEGGAKGEAGRHEDASA